VNQYFPLEESAFALEVGLEVTAARAPEISGMQPAKLEPCITSSLRAEKVTRNFTFENLFGASQASRASIRLKSTNPSEVAGSTLSTGAVYSGCHAPGRAKKDIN
jgi:hypothetical protein